MRLIFLTFLLSFLGISLFAGVKESIGAIKILNIHSDLQKITNKNQILFSGHVEILLDYKIHMWADEVEVDKEKRTVVARANNGRFVKLENPDLVMLADSIELHLDSRTGNAKNIKIHVKEGFVSADSAEKIDEQTWKMRNLSYTSCDNHPSHWKFTAYRAALYKNSVLRASGLCFKIYNVPIFAFPVLVFPLQNRAGSGFLMPRLSFDAELGFGFRQDYYWFLGDHCDTTMGINFVEKKGYILSNEFRWAAGPENYFVIDSHFADEWNALTEKGGKIVSGTKKHYWVQGKYFQPFSLGKFNLQSLIRFDFGTDKRIGYHFLNDVESVEDSFYNTITQRYRDDVNLMEISMHSERALRRQFSDVSNGLAKKKKEREEKVYVHHLPHYEWNMGYKEVLPKLFYRHDIVFDHALLEECNIEKMYRDDFLEEIISPNRRVVADAARFFYKGRLSSTVALAGQRLRFFVEPHLQARFGGDGGGYDSKLFARGQAELAFAELSSCSRDASYAYFIQPIIRWSYLQKFPHSDWPHIDKYDRFYPENRLEFLLRNNWFLRDWTIDLLISQRYDFFDNEELFPLHRCYVSKHLLPLRAHVRCSYKWLDFFVTQEYCWKNLSLIQSEIGFLFSYDKFDFFVKYLYQKERLQRERELFSDIPAFALVGGAIRLGKKISFSYGASFYSKYRHMFPMFNTMKPMLHQLHLDYSGHCWGISVGWEEKRYRQYGSWKSERALTLSLRLESIGSFAQKFRRPVIQQAPEGY